MSTTSHAPHSVEPAVAPTSAGRLRVVAAALATSAATVAVLVATQPWGERLDSSSEEILSYATLQPHRDAAWPSILLDGFALAVLGISAALATCHLARGRGRVAALLGSLLAIAGGVLCAMGSSAFVTMVWFATGLSEEGAADLIVFANDHPGHLLGVQMAGFALFTLGTLTLSVALARAKAVPLAAVLGFVALTVGLFVPLPGRGIDVVQVAQMLLIGTLAVPLWRRAAL
jgi:hypothetical protein